MSFGEVLPGHNIFLLVGSYSTHQKSPDKRPLKPIFNIELIPSNLNYSERTIQDGF